MHFLRRRKVIGCFRRNLALQIISPVVPCEIFAEVIHRQAAHFEPLLHFLGRDQIMVVAKFLHRRVNGCVVHLSVAGLVFTLDAA